jgi:hypothetical protein
MNWISIKDKSFPLLKGKVLLVDDAGSYYVYGMYVDRDNMFVPREEDVRYWMMLPPLPKEKNELD